MTRSSLVSTLCSLALLGVVGCDDGGNGEGGSSSDAGDVPETTSDAGDVPAPPVVTPRPTPPDSEFEELLAYDWEIEPGVEDYYCVYKTVTEELWISDFKPISPDGTHHVTIGMVENGPDDGVVAAGDEDAEFPCNGVTLGDQLAYSAVFNTPGLSMPEGVATRIPAGKKLLLSVHVFNGGDTTLSGHTGIAVVKVDPETVENEAENIFALNVAIQVEPGKTTQTSECTIEADGTILSLTHHMHLTGVRQKTTLIREGGAREVLLDEPFVFDSQGIYTLDPPVAVREGDTIEVECQFDNPTSKTFTFGESTGENEMCLTSFYRFPAVAESFLCLD